MMPQRTAQFGNSARTVGCSPLYRPLIPSVLSSELVHAYTLPPTARLPSAPFEALAVPAPACACSLVFITSSGHTNTAATTPADAPAIADAVTVPPSLSISPPPRPPRSQHDPAHATTAACALEHTCAQITHSPRTTNNRYQ